MLFEVGETVVYPHHGAATITEVKKRIIKGEEKLYLKLNVTQGDLVIEVPAENVDLVAPVQGEPREARLRRCHQGLRSGPRPVAPRPGSRAVGRREAHARQGTPDPDLRARARREDRRGAGLDRARRGARLLGAPPRVGAAPPLPTRDTLDQ